MNCQEAFQQTGLCYPEMCAFGCQDGIQIDGCLLSCGPKPCLEIEAKNCPLDRCQLIKGCDQKKDVCYEKELSLPACGELGYVGQAECCEGFVKRCGYSFFDGTCDMIGTNSVYAIPICIPCGNKICNQFEDQCNCPEDCKLK